MIWTGNRRDLLKAGLMLAAGLAGASAPARAEPSSVRWGMLIVTTAFRDAEVAARIVSACHTAHNVPDIPPPPPDDPNAPDQRVAWMQAEPFTRAFPEQEARFLPEHIRQLTLPVLCNHCEHPPCVRVCPTGATFQAADGRVGMDQHRCIGCRYCLAACPYGARSFNFCDPRPFVAHPVNTYPTRVRGVVEKCTFCPERTAQGQAPWCVEASEGAIVFGDFNDPASSVRQALSRHTAVQRRPGLGTGPMVFYVL